MNTIIRFLCSCDRKDTQLGQKGQLAIFAQVSDVDPYLC